MLNKLKQIYKRKRKTHIKINYLISPTMIYFFRSSHNNNKVDLKKVKIKFSLSYTNSIT